MQLTPFCLMLSCLRISPDRSQFFIYDTISLTCEGPVTSNSSGWTVRRETPDGGVRRCSFGWGSVSGSTCVIRNPYPTDSGVYWCESVDGEQSNGVNITVTDHTVLLESPALPVPEAATVTLRCKTETNSTSRVFEFYKDGHRISSSSRGELTIHSASRSDQGLYTCGISGAAESPSSWLAVNGATHHISGATDVRLLTRDVTAFPPTAEASLATSTFTSSPPAASCLMSVIRLTCYLLTGTFYLLFTIALGLTYRNRKKVAQTVADRTGRTNVVMEVEV